MTSIADLSATIHLAAITALASAALATVLVIGYACFARASIRRYFGEISRRDTEPRRRRQQFEGRIWFVLISVALAPVLRVMLPSFAPGAVPFVDIFLVTLAALSGWSAFRILRDPFPE